MSSPALSSHSSLKLLVKVNLLSTLRRLRSLLKQSPLLTALILVFILGYLVLAYGLFVYGLHFISKFAGFGSLLLERLLFLMFAFLFVLLLISNLVISYTNLFRNRETAFLLTLPVPTRTIFRWKLMESTTLASWAFIFLIAPFLAAYGLTRGVPWHFYPVTVFLVLLFIVLPALAGSFIAVNVARFLDRRVFQVVALFVVLAIIAGAAIWFGPTAAPADANETKVVLDKMLLRSKFAHYPYLPSYWLSSSVLHWSEGALSAALFFILVLLSYVLFFGTLAVVGMGSLFYEASSAVQSRASVFGRWRWLSKVQLRKRTPAGYLGLLERFTRPMRFLDPGTRAIIVKDTRMFWRDTTQWAQSLMLFGLLGVYILNLRHFSQQLSNPFWIHLVSFLNLGACSLNLATLTTRFVYPQFSLEGKRLWIVGLAPLGMPRIVKIKFWLASVTSLIVTMGLMMLSCYMLQMHWLLVIYFAIGVTVMTFTLTALAVGLGVLYPNFKEENPSKIVSGFGGTFCLVLSFLYILGSAILLALASPIGNPLAPAAWQRTLALSGFMALSAVLGLLPMVTALRRLKNFEM